MKTATELLTWLDENNAFTDDSRKALTSGIVRKIKNRPDLIKEFQLATSLITDNIAELIYNIVNPSCSKTCEVCGNSTVFDKYYNGYRKTCSSKCAHEITLKTGTATKLKKYGDAHYNNSVKNKQTKFERYGDSTFTNVEKGRKTKLEKYGNEHYNNMQKYKETCLNKYGVDNVSKVSEIRQKQRRTLFERYGVVTPMESEKIKQIYQENYLKNKGVSWPLQDKEVRKKFNFQKETSNEKAIEEFLKNRGFHYQYRYICNNKEFDFAVFNAEGELVLLIETDGEYFHGLLSDCDGKNVQGAKDCERFLQTPENVKLLIVDASSKKEDIFKEILHLFNIDYNQWINEIIESLPQEFPYPTYPEKRMLSDWRHLQTYNYNKGQKLALSVIRNFHKSIYTAHVSENPSPVQAWQNKELLRKCVQNRFIYSNKLSSQAIADGFNICKIAPKVSIFNPSLARHLIEKYLSKYNSIFDPFSGFSGRMLGACSLNKSYVGQDISRDHVSESQEIIKFLNLNAQVKEKDILDSHGIYECLFTCPPYGGKEHWNILNDLVEKSCDEWIDECLNRFDCFKYLFVVDETSKYKDNIVETLINKSHLVQKEEYVVLISREK